MFKIKKKIQNCSNETLKRSSNKKSSFVYKKLIESFGQKVHKKIKNKVQIKKVQTKNSKKSSNKNLKKKFWAKSSNKKF